MGATGARKTQKDVAIFGVSFLTFGLVSSGSGDGDDDDDEKASSELSCAWPFCAAFLPTALPLAAAAAAFALVPGDFPLALAPVEEAVAVDLPLPLVLTLPLAAAFFAPAAFFFSTELGFWSAFFLSGVFLAAAAFVPPLSLPAFLLGFLLDAVGGGEGSGSSGGGVYVQDSMVFRMVSSVVSSAGSLPWLRREGRGWRS